MIRKMLIMWLATVCFTRALPASATSTHHEARQPHTHDPAQTREHFMEDGHLQESGQDCPHDQKGAFASPEQPPASNAKLLPGREMTEQWDMLMGRINQCFGASMPQLLREAMGLSEYVEPQMQSEYDFEQPQHDTGYAFVNNRLGSDIESGAKQQKQLNWDTWKNVISYNPSGQALILEHSHGGSKTPTHSDYQQQQQDLSPPLTNAAPELTSKQQSVVGQLESPPKQLFVPQEATKQRESNELNQQDVLQYTAPINTFASDGPDLVGKQLLDEQVKSAQTTDVGFVPKNTTEQRIRNSWRSAADLARQTQSRAQQHTRTGETSQSEPMFGSSSVMRIILPSETPARSALDSAGGTERQLGPTNGTSGWDISRPVDSSTQAGRRESPVFLGYGQLQRIEPLSENARTQARLSCQFGSDEARNVSISNVEWAKFSTGYDANQANPPFECPDITCDLSQVKTDAYTTVHPRPAIQHFVDGRVPSYSITLHDVQSRHLGVYRCSAVRRMDGRSELVYRIVPFQ